MEHVVGMLYCSVADVGVNTAKETGGKWRCLNNRPDILPDVALPDLALAGPPYRTRYFT